MVGFSHTLDHSGPLVTCEWSWPARWTGRPTSGRSNPLPFVRADQITPAQGRHLELLEQFQTLTARMEYLMATLNESVTTLFTDIANQIQQISAGLDETIANLSAENADLKADELASLQETVTSEQARIEGKSEELQADDPQPEPA